MEDLDMRTVQDEEPTGEVPLRLWPGVIIVVLQWLTRFVLPRVVPEAMPIGMMGGLLGGLAIVVWWAFFSRAPRSERWGAIAVLITAILATLPFLHESIATGMMGMLFALYATPVLCLAFVVWAMASRRLATKSRWMAMVASLLLASGTWALVKTGGFTGDGDSDFSWRWSATAEDRLLAEAARETLSLPSSVAEMQAEAEWPGFRGADRDGRIRGTRIETDWSASPPTELWRRGVGPGWSSFAVQGDLVYTQEQRGDEEVVSCYRASTGEPVWRHGDSARFWESNAGAGPRGTPTLAGGRVYSLGATGILNVLDATDGTVVWSRNTTNDTDSEIPTWGISGSPLVVDDVVIVAVSGRLAAYGLVGGDLRWTGPIGGTSYSSPHLATIDGIDQILQLSDAGAISVAASDGTLLWEHAWKGYPIVQPALTESGDVLLSVTEKSGLRRLSVGHGSQGWTLEERWTSRGLKPYFNDFVVHEGHAYGFDGRILSCIDLETGERKWKGGRYGNGQLVLLADQDLLLVLSEGGELALVGATAEGFSEFGSAPAIEGKTWNHPVLVGDILLVRNGQEMVGFRLALEDG